MSTIKRDINFEVETPSLYTNVSDDGFEPQTTHKTKYYYSISIPENLTVEEKESYVENFKEEKKKLILEAASTIKKNPWSEYHHGKNGWKISNNKYTYESDFTGGWSHGYKKNNN